MSINLLPTDKGRPPGPEDKDRSPMRALDGHFVNKSFPWLLLLLLVLRTRRQAPAKELATRTVAGVRKWSRLVIKAALRPLADTCFVVVVVVVCLFAVVVLLLLLMFVCCCFC